MSQNNALAKIGPDDIKTLVQAGIIPADTPAPQIAVFAHVAKERGLSPFSKEIYLVKYGQIYSTIVGINGLRKIAAQTGELAGCDDVQFNRQPDGQYLTAAQIIKANPSAVPTTATITVYRMIQGQRCPFTHTVVFNEFKGTGPKWHSMPFQMIAKVAEAFALRKAFSERTAGLDIEEEQGAYEQVQVREVDALESARSRCSDLLDQSRAEEQDFRRFQLLIHDAESVDELRIIYRKIQEIMPEDADPARQTVARENALGGRHAKITSPSKNQFAAQ